MKTFEEESASAADSSSLIMSKLKSATADIPADPLLQSSDLKVLPDLSSSKDSIVAEYFKNAKQNQTEPAAAAGEVAVAATDKLNSSNNSHQANAVGLSSQITINSAAG